MHDIQNEKIALFTWMGSQYIESLHPECALFQRILGTKSIPYSLKYISAPDSSDALRIYSKSFPILKINDREIQDIASLLAFTFDHYPEPLLIPTDTRKRADCFLLMEWALGSFYLGVNYLRMCVPENTDSLVESFTPEVSSQVNQIALKKIRDTVISSLQFKHIGRVSYDDALEQIHRQFEHVGTILRNEEFLVDGKLSLADIAVFNALHGYFDPTLRESTQFKERYPDLLEWAFQIHKLTADTKTGVYEKVFQKNP